MEKLSDLISKKIFSFAQGRKIGYVLNVKFDNAFNIDKIIVASEEDEKELELSADRIRISGDNIFIENENAIVPATSQVFSIIGKQVFTNRGTDLGRVIDVYLSNKKAVCIISDKLAFSPRQIGVIGQDAIILGKVNIPARQVNVFAPKGEEEYVSIMPIQQKIEPQIPQRVSMDSRSLIGKMATKDIFGLNNELIIKKYEIITQKKLDEIKKHNKLNILFYNCK